jgi:hypothetical protein
MVRQRRLDRSAVPARGGGGVPGPVPAALVLIAAGLGVALPAPGRWLDASGAILITLAVLVFCTGSSVTFADIGGMRAAAGRMALVLAATTVLRRCWPAGWSAGRPRHRLGHMTPAS